jgi:hypothetical protein
MAPSQTRLVLTAITGEKLWRERVDFWKSVYGESKSQKSLFSSGIRLRHVNNEQLVLW